MTGIKVKNMFVSHKNPRVTRYKRLSTFINHILCGCASVHNVDHKMEKKNNLRYLFYYYYYYYYYFIFYLFLYWGNQQLVILVLA